MGLILCFLVSCQDRQTIGDFRGHSWGDSAESVRKKEQATLVSSKEGLAYEGSIAGISVLIMYIFTDGKLSQAGYLSQESQTNENRYIEDYEELKNFLGKKYGQPDSDRVTWKNDQYRESQSDWGTALSIGHLLYRAEWNTDSTMVETFLGGDNSMLIHGIRYHERASMAERERKSEEEALDQL